MQMPDKLAHLVRWRTWISIKCLLKGSINLPIFLGIIWNLSLGPDVDSAPDVIDVCFQQREDRGLVHVLSNDFSLCSPAEEREWVQSLQ